MHLPSFIARRYLFSKAHRNVINIISIVSAVAIGIGCMALIIILSVYNGFDNLVESAYNSYIPDYVIEPAKGKTIFLSDEGVKAAVKELREGLAVESGGRDAGSAVCIYPVLEETVYVQYDVVQSIARIKGVPAGYDSLKRLQDNIVDGDFELSFGDLPRAVVEEGLAISLMLRPQFSTPLEIYLPSRTEDISLMMPQSSLLSRDIRPSGIIQLSSTDDKGIIYVPVDIARELMEYGEKECTKIEVFVENGADAAGGVSGFKGSGKAAKAAVSKARKALGESCVLKDRYQQNETVYKMMRAEKFAIYMILLFVVAIISVNLLSSLSMLIIEKKEDIGTYQAMGMKDSTIRKTFLLHGWLVCISGALVGIIVGLILCWIQHRWGVIPLPGNFLVNSYPIEVKLTDVLLALVSVAAVGFVMAYIPTRSIREG